MTSTSITARITLPASCRAVHRTSKKTRRWGKKVRLCGLSPIPANIAAHQRPVDDLLLPHAKTEFGPSWSASSAQELRLAFDALGDIAGAEREQDHAQGTFSIDSISSKRVQYTFTSESTSTTTSTVDCLAFDRFMPCYTIPPPKIKQNQRMMRIGWTRDIRSTPGLVRCIDGMSRAG